MVSFPPQTLHIGTISGTTEYQVQMKKFPFLVAGALKVPLKQRSALTRRAAKLLATNTIEVFRVVISKESNDS